MRIEINENTLKALIKDYLDEQLGSLSPKYDSIRIEVKSRQNYKAEWEAADFRAIYEE